MRKFALPLALVAVLAATVALAAKPEVLSFQPLGASSVSGDARLMSQKDGTRIQVHLDNLVPETDYIATWSSLGAVTCDGGTQFVTFTSNKQGKAVANELVPGVDIGNISRIGVAPLSNPLAIEACTQ